MRGAKTGREVARATLVRAALAAPILMAGAFYEAHYGYRLGEAAGWRAENAMGVAILLASAIVVGPLARTRLGLAACAAFLSVFVLWAVNARYSTSLDVRYGGAYGWTGERIAVLTWLVGPVLGALAAALALAAHLLARRRPFAGKRKPGA